MINIIRKIKDLLYKNNFVYEEIHSLHYKLRAEQLTDYTLHSTCQGIANTGIDAPVIVSLTSYGRRIHDVYLPIESIMQGSMLPDRIILWLDKSFKEKTLPITLQKQQKRGLEIRFCEDIRSYKKLIPTLQLCPEANIITIDDDLLYDFDLVERLINEHINHPKDIIASRIHRMVLDKNHHPIPYNKWHFEYGGLDSSPLNFVTGGAGTLYPPECFDTEVSNKDAFMYLCPLADDVWFNAMALKKRTAIRKATSRHPGGRDYLMNDTVQDMGLWNTNCSLSQNDKQLRAVFEKYDLYKLL